MRSIEKKGKKGEKRNVQKKCVNVSRRKILKDKELQESSNIIFTQKNLAKELKVSLRTVQNWSKNGMPRLKKGYDVEKIRVWIEFKKISRVGAGEQIKWENYYREMKARLAELEYQKAIGEVIPKAKVEEDEVEKILAVKSALLLLPHSLPQRLAGCSVRKIKKIIYERVKDIVNEFAGVNVFSKEDRELYRLIISKNKFFLNAQ